MNYSNYEIINYYFFAKNTSVARLTGRTLDPPMSSKCGKIFEFSPSLFPYFSFTDLNLLLKFRSTFVAEISQCFTTQDSLQRQQRIALGLHRSCEERCSQCEEKQGLLWRSTDW